jgi:hypothetical protein
MYRRWMGPPFQKLLKTAEQQVPRLRFAPLGMTAPGFWVTIGGPRLGLKPSLRNDNIKEGEGRGAEALHYPDDGTAGFPTQASFAWVENSFAVASYR